MEPGCFEQQRDERRVPGRVPSSGKASRLAPVLGILSAATAAGDICEPQKLLALSTTENKSMGVDKHTHIYIYVQGHYFTEAAGYGENPINFSAFLSRLFGL